MLGERGGSTVQTQALRRPVARIVLYEISEAVTFGPSRELDESGAPKWVRTAEATLFGKDVQPLGDHPVFTAGTVVTAHATSAVTMPGGEGTIACAFALLMDSDPTRVSLDKLVVTSSGRLEGSLDLRAIGRGHASADGRWSLPDAAGTFCATFLVPTRRTGYEGSWYVEHDADGRVTAPDGDRWQPVRADECVLGMPATKVVLQVFEASAT